MSPRREWNYEHGCVCTLLSAFRSSRFSDDLPLHLPDVQSDELPFAWGKRGVVTIITRGFGLGEGSRLVWQQFPERTWIKLLLNSTEKW